MLQILWKFCVMLMLPSSDVSAEYITWTYEHSECTMQIDYKGFTVSKSNVKDICHEANYMNNVHEGLRNGSQISAYEESVLTSIFTLYDELHENRKPQLIILGGGQAQEKPIYLHPISFGIPVNNLVTTIPHKNQSFARVIPGKASTYYDLHGELDFFKDMERSLFSITYKKAGWDCLRLLEIIAAGSMPLFTNIAQCPDHALVAHPKTLYKTILDMPGLTVIGRKGRGMAHHFDTLKFDTTQLNKSLYLTIMSALLHYTHNVLTTSAMAAYVLDTMHIYSNGLIPTAQPRRVLYLTHVNPDLDSGDYMIDLLLHGLKTLLGDKAVVDFPHRNPVYKTENEFNTTDYLARKKGLYGNGFSWGLTIDAFTSSTQRDQSVIRQNIENNVYDVIIMGSGHRDGWGSKLLLWDVVCEHYNPLKVGWVEGADSPVTRALLQKYANCAGHMFSREGYAGK